jgi:CRISPR-associated protein (TIGR02584 family)
MNTSSPVRFPRRVLLAVTGLSPQVVTETRYALTRGREPFVPSEIHLVATVEGAERARLFPLSEQPGGFLRFCRDYGLPAIDFDSGNIHIPRTPGDTFSQYLSKLRRALGEPLADSLVDGGGRPCRYKLGIERTGITIIPSSHN